MVTRSSLSRDHAHKRFVHFPPVLFVSSMIGFASCAAPDIEPTVADDVLVFAATDLDGNPVTHEDERFQEKVLLVDIWGTWCPPCQQSIPKLVELQDEYGDDGLVVVGIAFEEDEDATERRGALRAFAEEYKINYVVLDGGTTSDVAEVFPTLEGFRGFPTMVIVGRDGKVTHANTVFVPHENKKIRAEVETALDLDDGQS